MVCSCVLKSSSVILSSGEMSEAPCGSQQATLSWGYLPMFSPVHKQACTLTSRWLVRCDSAAAVMPAHDLSLCVTEPATTRIWLQPKLVTADVQQAGRTLRCQSTAAHLSGSTQYPRGGSAKWLYKVPF